MKLLNKILKVTALIGVRLMVLVSLFLLAMFVTSPVICIAVCIADAVSVIPSFLHGRLWLIWLCISIPFFIGFEIYTEVKSFKARSSALKQK